MKIHWEKNNLFLKRLIVCISTPEPNVRRHVNNMSALENRDICGAYGCGEILPVVRMTCSKCKITSYCSKACQVESWRNHKKDCNKNNSFLSDVISLNKCILKKMGDFNTRISKVFALLKAGKYKEILTMESEILECVRVAEGNDDPNHLVMLYAALGDAYRFTGDRVSGLEYMKKSKVAGHRTDMREPVEETNKILSILSLGETYRDMENIEEAMKEYRQCYELVGDETAFKDEILLGMAKCHVHEGRYSEALYDFNASIAISEQTVVSTTTRCQSLVGISRINLLMGQYETAVLNSTTAIELMNSSNDSQINALILSVRQDITIGMAMASWAVAMDHKTNTQLVRGTMRKSSEFVANTQLWTDVMKRSESLFQQSVIEKTDSQISIYDSDVQLWLAYVTYSLGRNEEALCFLRKFLDMQIDKPLNDQCRFCGQINTAKCVLLKCSACRVSKFCSVACQKAASTKRHMATGRIVVTHKTVCPLLTQWRKVKRGQISKGFSIQAQLQFLKECVPYKEMVLRHAKYNQADFEFGE